jgi:murein DD-endopeptidase MepM/ murein hydrolase activator NlpD
MTLLFGRSNSGMNKRQGTLGTWGRVIVLLCCMLVFYAASADLYLTWQPNLQTPGLWVRTTNGTVGGAVKARLVLAVPDNQCLSIVASTLEEQTTVHATNPLAVSWLSSEPRPEFGDVEPPAGYRLYAWKAPYLGDDIGHNGSYHLSVTVRQVECGAWGGQDTPYTLTFGVKNLLIESEADTERQPLLIAWKPGEMSSVHFTVDLEHAQQGLCGLNYQVFQPDQSPVEQRSHTAVRPGSDSWAWGGVNGEQRNRLYLWTVRAEPDPPPRDPHDLNASPFLRITNVNAHFIGLDPLTQYLKFYLTYQFGSTPIDPGSTQGPPASSAAILVFDPDLYKVHNEALSALAPDTLHNCEIYLPVWEWVKSGDYAFIVTAEDHHRALDRGHRIRPALPMGRYISHPVNQSDATRLEIVLTDPQDDPPMLFRGLPEVQAQGYPCPVVLKGWFRSPCGQETKLVFTWELIGYDTSGSEVSLTGEIAILPGELRDLQVVWNAAYERWDFRAIWDQRLPRSTRMPLSYYQVRAYAVCQSVQGSVPLVACSAPRKFQVLSMAHPANGSITSGYGLRQAPPISTYTTTGSGNTLILTYPGGENFHTGVDYGVGAGSVVNSAEYGTVVMSNWTPWKNKGDETPDAIPPSKVNKFWEMVYTYMLYTPDAPYWQQRWQNYLRSDVQFGDIDGANTLGPSIRLDHGMVNLKLLNPLGNQPYETKKVWTQYGHLAEHSENMGSTVDISVEIARVGNWNSSNPTHLTRGYFMALVTLTLTELLPPHKVVWEDEFIAAFPSLTGSHLHFEVEVGAQEITQNPAFWTIIPFGQKQ